MEQDIPYGFQQFLPIIAPQLFVYSNNAVNMAAAGMSYQVNVNMLNLKKEYTRSICTYTLWRVWHILYVQRTESCKS